MRQADGEQKKPPARITVAAESKILASREEAAQLLSISQRALDYLIPRRGGCQHGALAAGFSSRFPSLGNMRVPIILSGSWRRRYRAPIACVVASGIEVMAEPLTNRRFGKPAHASGQLNRSKV